MQPAVASITTVSSVMEREHVDSAQVSVEPSEGFVLTEAVQRIADRAHAYLRAGYPVHLCGPTGTGKTTLAFHVAGMLRRPIVLLHGDHQLTSADLIGSPSGTRMSRVVDNYIRSVVRTEEERRDLWVDNRLTSACRHGHTLIYDEFNRSTAEANNPLLSVFSERILNLPKASDGRESYLRVHPDFAAILTSNPEEYAGVFRAPDALLDRVITLQLDYYDADTENSIVAARSGVDAQQASRIVQIVRDARARAHGHLRPTIRAAITIARVVRTTGARVDEGDALFRACCMDVLGVDPYAGSVRVDDPAQSASPARRDAGIEAPAAVAQTAPAPGPTAPESSPVPPAGTGARRKRTSQPAQVGWLHAIDESTGRER